MRNVEQNVDLELTPWCLTVKGKDFPLEVFFYFATIQEAKDQEISCKAFGWVSQGVMWYQ